MKTIRTDYVIPTLEKLTNFSKYRGVGFDELFNLIDNVTTNTYPPHNIYKIPISDTVCEYVIQLPLIGRTKEDVNITLDNKSLIVKVNAKKMVMNNNIHPEYSHAGLALRGYEKTFTITENIEVINVTAENGLLEMHLRNKEKQNSLINIEIN